MVLVMGNGNHRKSQISICIPFDPFAIDSITTNQLCFMYSLSIIMLPLFVHPFFFLFLAGYSFVFFVLCCRVCWYGVWPIVHWFEWIHDSFFSIYVVSRLISSPWNDCQMQIDCKRKQIPDLLHRHCMPNAHYPTYTDSGGHRFCVCA